MEERLFMLIEKFANIAGNQYRPHMSGGIWVTGHPGIGMYTSPKQTFDYGLLGKSTFLSLLCCIRCFLRLPSIIIQKSPDSDFEGYYYCTKDKKVFKYNQHLHDPILRKFLPSNLWVLVDCSG